MPIAVLFGLLQVRLSECIPTLLCSNHKVVILVVATTGEGDATDDAQKFHKYITSKSTPPGVFEGLNYTVFGLGDMNYMTYNQAGKRVDSCMQRLGGNRFYQRGEGDASQDIEEDLQTWINGGLIPEVKERVLVNHFDTPEIVSPVKFNECTGEIDTPLSAFCEAIIVSIRELRQHASSLKSTKEIILELPQYVRYNASDSIEVLPRNPHAVTEQFSELFKSSSSTYLDLCGKPSDSFIRNMRIRYPHWKCDDLTISNFPTVISLLQYLVKAFGVLPGVLEHIPLNKPRPYTAASAGGTQVKLIVSLESFMHPLKEDSPVLGVCSSYICNSFVGDKILVRVRPCSTVRIGPQCKRILSISTGAGIAPVLAYLDDEPTDRKELTIIFGCRHPDKDFIYRDILLGLKENANVITAVSELDHVYVQDKLKQFLSLGPIDSFDRIIVCGNPSMCMSVHALLEDVCGKEYVVDLIRKGVLGIEKFTHSS